MNLKRLLLIINICLAGLVLWTGSSIFLTWRSSKEEKGPSPSRPSEPSRKAGSDFNKPKTLQDYRIIIDRDIFATAKKAAPRKEAEIAKVTKLDLKLKGTVIGGSRNSFAVIEDGITRREELYSINDFVQGARIVRILPDQVILNLGGREETLIMTEETSPANTKISPKKRVKAPRIGPGIIEMPKRRPKR